jgi:diaminopimelate decarboxylase
VQLAKAQADKYGYHIHYAVKANFNDTILKTMSGYGLGADCVSGQEVQIAIDNGFKANEVVFAGVGKSDSEIITALNHDIFMFNCESPQEIEIINELAIQQNKIARIALRINPNVNANTHKHITTGLKENKFGIDMWAMDGVLEVIKKCSNIQLIGLHFHIGSQITDLNSFKELCTRVNTIQDWFISRHVEIKILNMGGGLGINYHDPENHPIANFEEYFHIFNQFLDIKPNQEVHFELGRSIIAQSGSLISKVLYIKNGIETNFAILDAGMTELIRPMLYQAHHHIVNLSSEDSEIVKYDIVGPICESTDCFVKGLEIPKTKRGDVFQIFSAGAYGEVMASNYNLKTLHPPVFSDKI